VVPFWPTLHITDFNASIQCKPTYIICVQIESMYQTVMASFKDHVRNVEWMDDVTRAKAMEKANIIVSNVGYPDFIVNPTELDAYYSEVCDFA